MTEEDFYTLKDCGEYYLLHARELPVPLHERILQEGFTEQIHNQEMHLEKSHSSLEVVDIEYTEEELEFEIILSQEGVKKYCSTGNVENAAFSKIRNSVISKTQNDSTDEEMKNLVDDDEEQVEVNDFKQELVLPEIKSSFEIAKYLKTNENAASDYYFILPKNTNELYEISDNMRNCVGYLYRSKVIEKACVIIVMMHNKRFVACIELRKMEDLRYHIVQLKGPMNKAVIGINYEVVKLWAKKFSIQMS